MIVIKVSPKWRDFFCHKLKYRAKVLIVLV